MCPKYNAQNLQKNRSVICPCLARAQVNCDICKAPCRTLLPRTFVRCSRCGITRANVASLKMADPVFSLPRLAFFAVFSIASSRSPPGIPLSPEDHIRWPPSCATNDPAIRSSPNARPCWQSRKVLTATRQRFEVRELFGEARQGSFLTVHQHDLEQISWHLQI